MIKIINDIFEKKLCKIKKLNPYTKIDINFLKKNISKNFNESWCEAEITATAS